MKFGFKICAFLDITIIVTAPIKNVLKIEHSRLLMNAWSKQHQNQNCIRFLYSLYVAKRCKFLKNYVRCGNFARRAVLIVFQA